MTCGIDLGEIHSIASFSSEGNAIIVTGRLLRSIKQYQLKKLAEFGRKLSKCKKNSRRYKKLRRAKRRMLQKTNAQIRDLNHKITRAFVTWAVENKISKVFVGNPEGVQRKKRRRIVSQKLSRWNFGKHLEYLKYKLASVGISIEKISIRRRLVLYADGDTNATAEIINAVAATRRTGIYMAREIF